VTSDRVERFREVVEYALRLDGNEKGKAQVFCDRLFRGFGHSGYKEAGASLEFRVRNRSTGGTSFADLVGSSEAAFAAHRVGNSQHALRCPRSLCLVRTDEPGHVCVSHAPTVVSRAAHPRAARE